MRRAGAVETCIGVFILLLLAGIAGGVYSVQSRFDPEFFRAVLRKEEQISAGKKQLPLPDQGHLPSYLPESLAPMGPEEVFEPDTLSDKIDGRAELYLTSGFVKLSSRRFASGADPKKWLELFIYDMGEPRNAFSVYSLQKRKDARAVDLGVSAYATEDALFFTNGPKYVEIIASTPDLGEEALALARNMIRADPQRESQNTQISLFPGESLDGASISLHMSDVFGFSGLDEVYTARYGTGDAQVTAFISRRESSDEAAALAASYGAFLLQNGATDMGEAPGIPGSRIYLVFDTHEIVMHTGVFLAGIHEVDSRDIGIEVAERIYKKLNGTAP